MKLKCFSVLLFSLLIGISGTFAQKLRTEQIAYNYTRIPSANIEGIRNYQLNAEATYEAKNQQLVAEYKQQKKLAVEKYNKEMAAYAILVKNANESYEKALAEYNKKTLGAKILEKSMLDNGKPKKEHIPQPYLERVEEPRLQSSFDYNTVLNTYVKLEGYQLDPNNALKINVLFYGFDHTMPRTASEERSMLSSKNGTTSTYKEMSYYTEFSYRHPMAVKVYTPAGKEILSVTPPELNSYKIYKGPTSNRPPVDVNSQLLIKTNEEKALQENLKFINNLLNDKYGYSSVSRNAVLYYIKNAESDYADLTLAFNEASSGLLMLQQDSSTAINKLKKAAEIWTKALNEADMGNKKARINKEIASGIYFNLLETYFAMRDVQSGQQTLEKLNSLSLSNEDRRTKLNYDVLFADLKKRQSQN